MEYPSGMQLYAAPKSKLSEEEAKAYIVANGYSAETVKLVVIKDQILVIRR